MFGQKLPPSPPACDSPEYAAGFTEIFLNLCGTVEMFYAFFDRIRKKYDTLITLKRLFLMVSLKIGIGS